MNKKTSFNKGFAFILFKNPDIIYEILKTKQVIQGRQIDCKLSFDAKYNELDRYNCSQCKIYIHNLGGNVNKNELNQYFSKYGEVKLTYVVLNSQWYKYELFVNYFL